MTDRSTSCRDLTLLRPSSIIVHWLPLFQDLDGRVARHFEPARHVTGHCGVHFGNRYGRVVLLQGLCNFFILRGKLFAVAAPSR